MFVDYLAITFKVPPAGVPGSRLLPGQRVAEQVIHDIRVLGLARPRGCTHCKLAEYPDGTLVKLDFGGSVIPIDLNDFVRWAEPFHGWTVSRLDLADNVLHATRAQVKVGQANVVRWYEDRSGPEGKVAVFTGCTLGKRGGCGSYYRLYDARKHAEGRVSKIARFGTDQFWRSEFELPREWLRRRGINVVDQLTVEKLCAIWSTESHGKGLQYDQTTEYVNLRPASDDATIEAELKEARRMDAMRSMLYKLQAGHVYDLWQEAGRAWHRLARAGFDGAERAVPAWPEIPL